MASLLCVLDVSWMCTLFSTLHHKEEEEEEKEKEEESSCEQ